MVTILACYNHDNIDYIPKAIISDPYTGITPLHDGGK